MFCCYFVIIFLFFPLQILLTQLRLLIKFLEMDRRLPLCDICSGLKEGIDPPNTYVNERVPRTGGRLEVKCLNLCGNARKCKYCAHNICPRLTTCSTSCKNNYDTCDCCSNLPKKTLIFRCQ